MDSLYVVMPAYNEEANIESVIRQWYPILSGKSSNSRMVIADSGSDDRTHALIVELQKEFPQLEILAHTEKQHGPKIIALYDYAIRNNADYIFQTDSDGQTSPDEFDEFWKMRMDFDGIFGHRKIREDGRSRAFIENVVCWLLKLYFGVKIPDANAPFRLMRSDVVRKYLYKMPPDYNLPNIILTTYFVRFKEKTFFKTISFRPRQGGKNSINVIRIVKIGWKALNDFYKIKKEMQI